MKLNKTNMLFLVGIKGQKGEPGITGDGSNESGKGFKVGSIGVVYHFLCHTLDDIMDQVKFVGDSL